MGMDTLNALGVSVPLIYKGVRVCSHSSKPVLGHQEHVS